MGAFIDRFSRNDPAYRCEVEGAGLVLIRRTGQAEPFNALTRKLINSAGDEFMVFPTSDGNRGYERVFVLPL